MSIEKNVNVKLSYEAQKIKELRKSQGIDQGELAQRAGITGVNISRIESGKQEPRTGTLRRIAGALGVSLAELIEPESSPSAHNMPLQPVDSIDPREWGHADMMLFRSLVAELAKMRDTNASLFLVFEKAIKSMASLTDAELQELSKSGTTELVRKLLGLE